MPATITVLLATALAISIGLVLYSYVVYPVLIYACSRLFGRPPRRPAVADDDLPTVTLLVAAFNEAVHIRSRIENALKTDYPAGKFEIVIASDGSTDDTCRIAREFAPRGVRVVAFPRRRGKASVLNDAIPDCRGDVVMLSDANTYTDPAAARQLAAWFADPTVGVVSGRLVLTDPVAGRNVDGIYWKYETFLKKCESRLGALLGSNGGIYALRRSTFTPIPPETLVDDFVIPLAARQRTGCQILYDRDAVACEETPDSIASEFHRRARIGAGGFQSMVILRSLLDPRHGWVAFTFFSHKLLRWFCPFFLAAALATNALLVTIGSDVVATRATWAALMACQVAFYAASLLSGYVPTRPRFLRALRLPAMFTMMNAALAVGFWRWIRNTQKAAWVRTERSPDAAAETAVDVGAVGRSNVETVRMAGGPAESILEDRVSAIAGGRA